MTTRSHIDAAQFRYDDLLAGAARTRLITTATQPSPSPSPTLRTVGRIRATLHQAVASLVVLASIG